MESYRRRDPAPQPELAVPVEVTTWLQQERAANPQDDAIAAVSDLATVAFFYLLRVGEYTLPAGRKKKTRTVQFRVGDVILWKNGRQLPPTSPLHILLQADGASLCIENQKNGTKGEVIYHSAIPSSVCPVKALARRIAAIMSADGSASTPISYVGGTARRGTHVRDAAIREAVRRAVTKLGLQSKGFTRQNVGSHSLRAGGAMAMKLNGADLVTIMKVGRWTSLTFLSYIHNQIAHLSQSCAAAMATPIPFFFNAGRA